jgi:hypothetical protein
MQKCSLLALAFFLILNMGLKAQNSFQSTTQGKNSHKNEMKRSQKSILAVEKRVDKMTQELGLSAEERVKVLALYEKQDNKFRDHVGDDPTMRDELKTKSEWDSKASDVELAKIIGPEKFQKWKEIRAKHEQKK